MKLKFLLGKIHIVMLLILLFLTLNGLKAQRNDFRGSQAFCNSSFGRNIGISTSPLNRSVAQNLTAFNTDFVSAGVGGMRDVGNGQITLSGLSGTVTRAYLYWHGVTNSTTDVGNSITVNATTVNGTNIGVSDNNCWGFNNSQAYRADITALVQSVGNGVYTLSGFGGLNPNGASLIVFYNDGIATNNRDVVIFDGNDSNVAFAGISGNPNAPADPLGWNVLLSGITYVSGTANIQMHVADGQAFDDDALKINTATLVPAGPVFQGNTVPGANNGPANNGRLWDIRSFNITSFLTPGPNTLNLTTGLGADCLGLIVAMIDLPAGAAPPTNQYYSKSTGPLHVLSTWGINLDGSGANPSDFGAGKTFNLANRAGIYTLTNDWMVGGLIVNPTGSQLQLNNFTLSEAGLSGGGTLTGSLTSSLIVTGTTGGDAGTLNFTPGAGNLFRFTVNRTGAAASVSIGSQPLNLYNTLTITSGTLNTNNVLTLKSNAANTARVNPITGAISGNVTVERYIPARRAWRILCAPITGTQTINAAWQEGAATTTANPAPNFGTFITGGSVVNGFDQSPGAVSSMKTYSNTSGWVPIATTNTTAVNATAYMTFIYGNRNNVTIPVDQTPGNTTLRSFGPLKVGDQTFAVAATGFTAVPNPFASPINFATITRTGVTNTFYLWDPKIGGINGVGAYVTVSFNGSTYDVSTNAISPESQFIQSGQGFLVFPSTSGTAGSVTIKESDKSNTAETDVFRTTGGGGGRTPSNAPVFQDPTTGQGLRLSLQTVNNDRSYTTLDEAFSSFNTRYSNQLDELDAVKPANIAENLGFAINEEQSLSIERRQVPVAGEEMSLKLWNTTEKSYVLSINPVNLGATGLYAYLKDKYLGTYTPVNLKEVSQVSFSISSNAASARSDRFSIVFSGSDKLPVVATPVLNAITAYPNPVTGNTLVLQFNQQAAGAYRIAILNNAGSTILEKTVQHSGGTAALPLTLDKKLLPGTYQLQVTGSTTKANVKLMVQ